MDITGMDSEDSSWMKLAHDCVQRLFKSYCWLSGTVN
jgi:hypothetical protein